MINFVNRMNEEELKKDLEKYGSTREKVLRLNEITKFTSITYGLDYIYLYNDYDVIEFMYGYGGCIFCKSDRTYACIMTLKVKNCNKIDYYTCNKCKNKKLCTYCLREKENCNLLTKQKIAFWLCTKTIFPKDIRRLITNHF
mgnify:FL=1